MSALDGKALLDHGEAIARRYASRVGVDLAEELRDEAVLRAFRSPPPDGRLEPWLERIYRNLLIDRWRQPQPIPVDVHALDTLGTDSTPEDAALKAERRRLVRTSLRRLPPEARQVLLSRYYGELDEATTASRLGIARPTVRTRLHRALLRLRTCLGDLRGLWPPLLGRLPGQLSTLGAAPVLVAALLVASASSPEQQQVTVTASEPEGLPVVSTVSTQPHPVPPQAPPAPPRPRVARKLPVAPPIRSAPLAPTPALSIVTEIFWPERLDIFAEPESSPRPCLVEAPTTFALQIEKMVEEEL